MTLFIIIGVLVFLAFIYSFIENKKEEDRLKRGHERLSYCKSKKCLAICGIQNGYVRDKQLIIDFIIRKHNPKNVKNRVLNTAYVEIWGDEDESSIINKMRALKDEVKLSVRQMLKPIFHKPTFKYFRKHMGFSIFTKEDKEKAVSRYGNNHLFPKDAPTEEFVSTAIDAFFDRCLISPSFFELPDDEFLEIINSGKTFSQKPIIQMDN